MKDLELRVAALRTLVDSNSPEVEFRLAEQLRRVEELLERSSDFDDLIGALEMLRVLAPKFHGAVLPILQRFITSLPQRVLTEDGERIPEKRSRYRSPSHLVKAAIDAAEPVRYIHTEKLIDFLLEQSHTQDKDVRQKAVHALEAVAKFNLDVYQSIGAEPQCVLVAHLGQLCDEVLLTNSVVIQDVLSKVLSPAIEGHSWNFDSLIIKRGGIVSGRGVAEARAGAIDLLKRMYPLSHDVNHRARVLVSLDAATRQEQPASDAETTAMFESNSIDVLRFMQEILSTAELPLVQAIEHKAYWIFYHASSDLVRAAALEVRRTVDALPEYGIYKQLIGFEGIFGDWEDLRRNESAWDYSDRKRKEAATAYVASIDESSYAEWRARILEFSKTRSDDLATFPVYYEFLENLGRNRPNMALELIAEHQERMERFLIPLLAGLWASVKKVEATIVVQRWIDKGEQLSTIARSFFSAGTDLEILAHVAVKAISLDDRQALLNVMGVAASLSANGASRAKEIFSQVLRTFAERGDGRWASAVWFNRDFRALARSLDEREKTDAFASLLRLPELNYEAEAVLFAIGEQDTHGLLDFLINRLRIEAERDESHDDVDTITSGLVEFEAIPYHLEKLGGLIAKDPERLLAALREDFDVKAAAFFPFRGGGRLIRHAFPTFGDPLESMLISLLEKGGAVELNFALAVARTYGGEVPIFDFCRRIVKTVPEHSQSWKELSAALMTTGVVWGEFGVLQAYEQRREEMLLWNQDKDSRVRAFAAWFLTRLERSIDHERRRATEELELRKYKYGGNNDGA